MLRGDIASQIRGATHLSVYLQDERLATRWLRNFARESSANWSKKRIPSRMQNRTRRGAASGVRITKKLHASQFYRRERRWARTKKAGRGTGRKFTSEDLARPSSLPLLPPSVALLMRSQPAAPNGVTLKERRATEIIPDNHHYMQRPTRNLLLNIVSGTRRLLREGRGIAMREKGDRPAAVKCPRRPRETRELSTRCSYSDIPSNVKIRHSCCRRSVGVG